MYHYTEEELEQIITGLLYNPHIGIVIVDKEGYITIPSQTYLDYLEMRKEDVVGKHVLEVTPNSKLHQVLKTGEVHLADLWEVNGHEIIVTRVPIIKNGEVIGAIGKTLFLDVSGLKAYGRKKLQLTREFNISTEEMRQIYRANWQFHDIVGTDNNFLEIKRLAERLSHTDSTVLVTGESGTGKELIAASIHNTSPRRIQPFIRLNCAALPQNLLESELFGYEEGAFSGARKGGKPGKFELASGGTVFLDEIGDMPLATQTTLLTVLQERVIERLGGTTPIFIDVRVIAATNQNLEYMVEKGRFRKDLFYRLNVVRLKIPPLRERRGDIPLLAKNLIMRINKRLHTNIHTISDEALLLLQSYHWPGNVRELENLLENALVLANSEGEKIIMVRHFPALIVNNKFADGTGSPQILTEALDRLEKEMVLNALERSGGNRAKAAKLLGLHTSALYRRLDKFGLIDSAES